MQPPTKINGVNMPKTKLGLSKMNWNSFSIDFTLQKEGVQFLANYKGENVLATEAGSKILVDLAEQVASTVGGGAELNIKEATKKRK